MKSASLCIILPGNTLWVSGDDKRSFCSGCEEDPFCVVGDVAGQKVWENYLCRIEGRCMILPSFQELMVNGKISWFDFCEHYIINIWEQQNATEDPSKQRLARIQDFIRGVASPGTLRTKYRPDATSQHPS